MNVKEKTIMKVNIVHELSADFAFRRNDLSMKVNFIFYSWLKCLEIKSSIHIMYSHWSIEVFIL